MKRAIYAEAGVPEYWIVDPLLGQIDLVAGAHTLAVVTEGSVESHVAQGLVVALSEIFPE
jgi:Uma2 family endonuclease